MILYELTLGNEAHPTYEKLAASSLHRQYHFLDSIIAAALELPWSKISTDLIQALNYHAIACLHAYAGEYRPCAVRVGSYEPPAHFRVPALMNEMVNDVNRQWDSQGPLQLAAYVLWRLNWIHPFVNGNGRTARALCHYVVCLKMGGFPPPGQKPIPVLIRENREEYVNALETATTRYQQGTVGYCVPVLQFLQEILASEPVS